MSSNAIYVLSEGPNFPNTKLHSMASKISRRNTANTESDTASLFLSELHLISPAGPLRRQAKQSEFTVLLNTNTSSKKYSFPFLSGNSVFNSAHCKLHQFTAVLPIHSFPHFCLTG